MRDGDRAVIIRSVANLQVGDRVCGLDADDYAGWVTLTKVERHDREYDVCYLLEPALGMFDYIDAREWVVVEELANLRPGEDRDANRDR